jgi:hypothetical protein
MPWFSHSPDRRRFPRFKADVLARANVVREDQILYLGTRCNSISEGGVDAPGLQSLALGDLLTVAVSSRVNAARLGRHNCRATQQRPLRPGVPVS